METITLHLSSQLASSARMLARHRGQKLSEFVSDELQRLLSKKAWLGIERRIGNAKVRASSAVFSDEEIMRFANARMAQWQAQQMHRLIHTAGTRKLTIEEEKILNTLLEIYNETCLKKAQGIAEAIRRGLLPSMTDKYWSKPNRRKLSPRIKR